ncbi:Pre-mRNA processing ribonucleoprotein, binding domain protein [halophilic archaeon DL31]|jgi:nucleolar protein 56|nr:Pre-mRNA processing ribonucleoprotein, binding domain protein [halophilic archaeon DL31]
MTDAGTDSGWFESVPPDDLEAARKAIENGSGESPKDWPTRAVEAGFAEDKEEYYDRLHEATIYAAREAAREAERADDKQLVHALRAMDDTERTANELSERLEEWAGALLDIEIDATGLDFAAVVADEDPENATEERAVSLAQRVVDLRAERDDLRTFIERRAPEVAPNLAEMAGPVLAARLISLAGGLEPLAKKPSGTVQVLGAEDALFAHLRGHAPSPKHGVIFTHEFVRGTRLEDRGSASRALAGKLSIAARIDHYSGDMRPDLHEELRDRMDTIRARANEADEAEVIDE